MDGGSVREIAGIGPARVKALAGLGIETMADLAGADAEMIAAGVRGVGLWQAAEWVQEARMREEATSRKAVGREKAVGSGQPRAAPFSEEDRAHLDPLRSLYEKGTWRGMERWQCKVCPWDTLKGEAAIREHVSQHVLRPARAEGQVLVADRWGRER